MTNIGTEATTSVVTRELCDASALPSEYAQNIVEFKIDGRPVSLALCGHHTNTHGAELLARQGATIVPIPDVYGDAEQDDTEVTAEVPAHADSRPPEPV